MKRNPVLLCNLYHKLCYEMRYALACLMRWNASHGFGVQSPWAYRFLQNVVRDRLGHDDVDALVPIEANLDARTHRLLRFYYRLSRSVPVASWDIDVKDADLKHKVVNKENIGPDTGCLMQYVLAKECTEVWIVSASGWTAVEVDSLLLSTDTSRILIMEGIHENRSCHATWKSLVSHPSTGVSFDLFDCGIIFFDLSMYKQSYKMTLG